MATKLQINKIERAALEARSDIRKAIILIREAMESMHGGKLKEALGALKETIDVLER